MAQTPVKGRGEGPPPLTMNNPHRRFGHLAATPRAGCRVPARFFRGTYGSLYPPGITQASPNGGDP